MKRRSSPVRGALVLFASLGALVVLLVVLGTRVTGLPPLGTLLDPVDGLYRLARYTDPKGASALRLQVLEAPVEVVRDERGVPHIYASSDADAVRAFGYVTAQDRLFQMDFIPRVAAGRLSEAVGEEGLETDRYLRATGMDWGARRNLAAIEAEGGIEWDLLTWYAEGVNAYIDALGEADLPLEFRLLGYKPDPWTPLQTLRMLQYMSYDLSFDEREPQLSQLRAGMDSVSFNRLFPEHSTLVVPIIPTPGGGAGGRREVEPYPAEGGVQAERDGLTEGFIPGKGSNNWAVAGARSATGMPILAGDMHLSLTLPAIWYEVHLVTPTMNTYGVTVPGAPLPVEAFNDHLGWAFTNTGADQLDHYRLEVNSGGTAYRFNDLWHDFVLVPDTLRVLRGDAVVDTLRYTHMGPVTEVAGVPVALRWTAHMRSRTLRALWGMNHATTYEAFENALRFWDTPMQNVLYAGRDGRIAMRSTGHLPVRANSTGTGLLDGTLPDNRWIGRVPFEALPHAVSPEQDFLTSTNQDPAGAQYPYYLGRDWRSNVRSLRIDSLLRGKTAHTVDDLKTYQSDVRAMQQVLYKPLLDTLTGLAPAAEAVRDLLVSWDGVTGVDRPEPLALYHFMDRLGALTWDEPVFRARRPSVAPMFLLFRDAPQSVWFDRKSTAEIEQGGDMLRQALAQAADTLAARYGNDRAGWRWGDHHKVVFRHLTRSEALKPLWRGPVEFPGFAETLSPASGFEATHSASWRMVVDFSQTPPQGWGVYPGGQSGNPFSHFYDLHLPAYVAFEHYALFRPATAGAIPAARVLSTLRLTP